MKRSVLFVCMGNICRSPTAHAVFRQMLIERGRSDQINVDSAGTLDYHAGHPPDRRAQTHALRRGYSMQDLRARQITRADYERHDWILVMDWDNYETLLSRCPKIHQHKIRRLTEYCLQLKSDAVPDPYYGGDQGFERVLDLVEDACRGLMEAVLQDLDVPQ